MDRPFTEEGGTAHKPSESPIIPDPPRVPKQPTSSTRRLKYVSWKAGGLHASRNRELKAWLQQPEGQQVHLVAVQETHWQGPLEYSTDRFHAVHSGGHKSEAGFYSWLIGIHSQPPAFSTVSCYRADCFTCASKPSLALMSL